MGRKITIIVFSLVLALFFLTLPGWGQEKEQKPGIKTPVERMETPKATKPAKSGFGIGLRLYGGWNYLDSGDLNPGISGYLDGQSYGATIHGWTYSGDYNSLHGGLNGGLDLLLHFGRHFSLVIGTEYFQAASDSERVFTKGTEQLSLGFHPEMRALPIKLGLMASLPLGKSLNVYLQGGIGYYWTQLLYQWDQRETPDWVNWDIDVQAGAIGYHADLGLELKLARKLFFFLEAQGRLVEVDGYSGPMTVTGSSGSPYTVDCRLYYFKISSPVGPFEMFWPDYETPAIPGISELREAEIDFSGVSARAGVRIRF